MKTPATPAFVALFTIAASAQDVPQDSTPAPSLPPVTVIKSWRADFGDRSIYLNRVAPSVLRNAPAAIPDANDQTASAVITPGLAPRKKTEILFLSAAVFSHQTTEFRWTADGHEFRACSNVNFNLLAGAPTFESADTVYSLLLAVRNTPAQIGQPSQGSSPQDKAGVQAVNIPALDKLSATQAQYLVAENADGSVPADKDLAAFDALHAFCDANRQQLTEAYAQREAARIEEESKPKAQPPKPPDTVVNFWPGKNTVIIEGNNKAIK